MPESLRDAHELGKSGVDRESSHREGEPDAGSFQGVGGFPSDSPAPISKDDLRDRFSDAYRRAMWQNTGVHAATLGLQASTIYNWTSGERRTPGESVYLTTERSVREGTDRHNATAIVRLLAELGLTPDELEDLAAKKRAESDRSARVIRLAARGVQSVADEVVDGRITGHDTLAIRREVRRIREAVTELEYVMDRATAHKEAGPAAGDG